MSKADHDAPSPVDAALFAPFDRTVAFAAFQRWQATRTPAALEEAVRTALPCVGFAFRLLFLNRSKFRRLDRVTRDEVLAAGAAEIFERLRNKRGFEGDAISYERYLVATARRCMAGTCPRPEVLDYDVSSIWYPMGRVRDIRDVEHQLILEKLPVLLWKYFRDHCRLTAAERHAAADVLRRILNSVPIDIQRMKQQFRLVDPSFIVDYVTVLMRRFLYELREEHGRMVEVPAWAPVWSGGGDRDDDRRAAVT